MDFTGIFGTVSKLYLYLNSSTLTGQTINTAALESTGNIDPLLGKQNYFHVLFFFNIQNLVESKFPPRRQIKKNPKPLSPSVSVSLALSPC